MTSSLLLSIPSGLASQRTTWMGPPSRIATIDTRDNHTEDGVALTAVIVLLGDHELLKFTYLDPSQLTALEQEVTAFNAAPDEMWAQMLANLAATRMQADTDKLVDSTHVVQLASDHLPARTFHFLELGLDWAEEISRGLTTDGPAQMSRQPMSSGVFVHISTAPAFPFGALELFNGPIGADQVEDISREVERYNADPAAALRAIARDVLIADYQARATDIARLAGRQRETVELLGRLA